MSTVRVPQLPQSSQLLSRFHSASWIRSHVSKLDPQVSKTCRPGAVTLKDQISSGLSTEP